MCGGVGPQIISSCVTKIDASMSANIMSKLLWRLRPHSGEWVSLAPFKVARSSHHIAVLSQKLYVFGGIGSNKRLVTATECYNISDGKWTMKASMKSPRLGFASVVAGGRIWTFGGFKSCGGAPNLRQADRIIECYDAASDRWLLCSILDTPLAAAAAHVVTTGRRSQVHKIFLAGGLVPSSQTGILHSSDAILLCNIEQETIARLGVIGQAVHLKWELFIRMSSPRHDHQLVHIRNCLLVIGGQTIGPGDDEKPKILKSVEVVNTKQRSCTNLSFELPHTLTGFAAVVLPPCERCAQNLTAT